MFNYLENSAALLQTDEDQDTIELLWCNKKFEKSLELSYFTLNQAFDFKIFKFEAIYLQFVVRGRGYEWVKTCLYV